MFQADLFRLTWLAVTHDIGIAVALQRFRIIDLWVDADGRILVRHTAFDSLLKSTGLRVVCAAWFRKILEVAATSRRGHVATTRGYSIVCTKQVACCS